MRCVPGGTLRFLFLAGVMGTLGAPVIVTGEESPAVDGAILERPLAEVIARDASLGKAVNRLQDYHILVCYEQLNSIDEHTGAIEKPRVNLDVKGVTVRAVLDEIVADVGGYRWEFDAEHGLVNLLPENAYAEQVHLSVHAAQVGLMDLLWESDLHLERFGIYLVHDGVWAPNMPVSIDVEDESLRNTMNALVAQAPGWVWQLVGVEGRRTLTLSYAGK
ncbi:MAG: hypothetical protein KAY32_07740 [Candidatus Eisenbacteria sp.]|nr:hypothetical protein [Candidatus Eisenbacteria bacterium]